MLRLKDPAVLWYSAAQCLLTQPKRLVMFLLVNSNVSADKNSSSNHCGVCRNMSLKVLHTCIAVINKSRTRQHESQTQAVMVVQIACRRVWNQAKDLAKAQWASVRTASFQSAALSFSVGWTMWDRILAHR